MVIQQSSYYKVLILYLGKYIVFLEGRYCNWVMQFLATFRIIRLVYGLHTYLDKAPLHYA